MSDPEWATWPDERLLLLPMRELGVSIEGTELEQRIAQVNAELEVRGLRFRPHYWLSDEWFTPDGVPGVAIPYYLAHPRLAKLELDQMLEVEGGDPDSCLRILRHEVGHAIDNAYQSAAGRPAAASSGRRTCRTPSTTRRNRTARVSSSISIIGTPKAIPTRTAPKRLPSGWIRNRCGPRAMRGGPRSANSNTSIA